MSEIKAYGDILFEEWSYGAMNLWRECTVVLVDSLCSNGVSNNSWGIEEKMWETTIVVILTTPSHLAEFPKQVKIPLYKICLTLYKSPQYLGFITHLDYRWITFNPHIRLVLSGHPNAVQVSGQCGRIDLWCKSHIFLLHSRRMIARVQMRLLEWTLNTDTSSDKFRKES